MLRDLCVGGAVFDETGAVCRVTAATAPMYDRPVFLVRFSDGEEVVADAAHEWHTAALRSGEKKGPKPAAAVRKGGYAIRETREIASTFAMPASASIHPQAKWNHRVDVAGALATPIVDLPIPPYALGAWLGDGNSDDARLTLAYVDWKIAEEIERECVSVAERANNSTTTARVILGSNGRAQSGRNASMQAKLRSLGLLGNKHIPPIYLRAGVAQRFALLQGI